MKTKKTSKKMAEVAASYLRMDRGEFYLQFCDKPKTTFREIQSLAASVLAQYEAEQSKASQREGLRTYDGKRK